MCTRETPATDLIWVFVGFSRSSEGHPVNHGKCLGSPSPMRWQRPWPRHKFDMSTRSCTGIKPVYAVCISMHANCRHTISYKYNTIRYHTIQCDTSPSLEVMVQLSSSEFTFHWMITGSRWLSSIHNFGRVAEFHFQTKGLSSKKRWHVCFLHEETRYGFSIHEEICHLRDFLKPLNQSPCFFSILSPRGPQQHSHPLPGVSWNLDATGQMNRIESWMYLTRCVCVCAHQCVRSIHDNKYWWYENVYIEK